MTVLFLLNWSLRLCMGRMDRIASSSSLVNSQANLILDAGHGGEDGGAVSLTGMPESQINLAVVLRMRDILAFYGVSPMHGRYSVKGQNIPHPQYHCQINLTFRHTSE